MNIIEWCDKMDGEYTKTIKQEVDGKVQKVVKTGKGNLRLVIEGGNDNGGITLECDHPDFNPHCDIANAVVNEAEEILGYGGWAGNFSVYSQEINYNSEEKTFEGCFYEESETDESAINIKDYIEIPKEDFVFDAFRFIIEGTQDNLDIYIELLEENGFPHPSFKRIADDISNNIGDIIENNVKNISENSEYDTVWAGYAEGTLSSFRVEHTENTVKIYIGDINLYCYGESTISYFFDLKEFVEETEVKND